MMNLADVIRKDSVIVGLKARDKKGVIDEMVRPLAQANGVRYEDLTRVLMERERLGSTGIGGGVGIPHGKLRGLENLILGIAISREGVNFDAIDGRPTHLFFVLVTPENAIDLHLKLLARISRMLREEKIRSSLLAAATPEEVLDIIRREDRGL